MKNVKMISQKYLEPTNTKGARLTYSDCFGRLGGVFDRNYNETCKEQGAEDLKSLGWKVLEVGEIKQNGNVVNVFVVTQLDNE